MNRMIDTPSSEDIDTLLSKYFKGEMPRSWPVIATPAAHRQIRPAVTEVPSTGRVALTSRMALAVSVALLLLGGWMLSDGVRPTLGVRPVRPPISSPMADPTRLKDSLLKPNKIESDMPTFDMAP